MSVCCQPPAQTLPVPGTAGLCWPSSGCSLSAPFPQAAQAAPRLQAANSSKYLTDFTASLALAPLRSCQWQWRRHAPPAGASTDEAAAPGNDAWDDVPYVAVLIEVRALGAARQAAAAWGDGPHAAVLKEVRTLSAAC